MKTKATKRLALLLAGLMLTACLAACGETEDEPTGSTSTEPATSVESETKDATQEALEAIGEIDYGKGEFGILYQSGFKSEVYAVNEKVDAEGGASQIINDAVYTRNVRLEELCNLKLETIEVDASAIVTRVQNEASAPTGDFKMIDAYIFENAKFATGAYVYDLLDLGVNLEGEWWDSGTADFVLVGGVYFMCGSLNFGDDNVTYILLFNKDLRKSYANTVPDPYETVRSWEWTLDHFNNIIQGVSKENGDGQWNELDSYGFVTTHEYGTTFFIGSGMRYILNDASVDEPILFLADSSNMEKALNTVNLARKIYHDNNVTYMAPGWEETKSFNAFVEDRALFYGETCGWIGNLSAKMDSEYGVLPIPKYDKAQENYHTWTHASGSSFSVTSAIPEAEKEVIGDIYEAFAILSHQYVKSAYYDTKLTRQNIRDADSAEMMDILFSNRTYEMGFYFDFNVSNIVHDCVNNNTDKFSSTYNVAARKFERTLDNLLEKLEAQKAQ